MKKILLPLLFIAFANVFAQERGAEYTSYFTGNTTNITTAPSGGICLMGGATEDDNAMKWFLQRANGGDILVLRASGSNGYNDYLYSQLGITVNSVETIVFNSASASQNPYIHQKINQAEAIWFAGGDQWNYVSYWRNTPIDSLINKAIAERNILIGGTSAGMAILGQYYFTAENGTVTSDIALNSPYNTAVAISDEPFINIPLLQHVITDTHYDNPDRRGRHVTFMARIFQDYQVEPRGIACEEYTAVCVEPNGTAHIYGSYPQYQDYAYFIYPNCESSDKTPETCNSKSTLTWNRNNKALNVYKVAGTATGSNTFNLSNWTAGSGGTWEHWWVEDGVLNSAAMSSTPNCFLSAASINTITNLRMYPNPTEELINISFTAASAYQISITDISGRVIKQSNGFGNLINLHTNDMTSGVYFMHIITDEGIAALRFMKK